jgi:hypothetical protein
MLMYDEDATARLILANILSEVLDEFAQSIACFFLTRVLSAPLC